MIIIFFKYKATCGRGTNDNVELLALKLTLMLDVEHGAINLQVFGDSQLAINWMQGEIELENFLFQPVFDEAQRLKVLFQSLSFCHMYKEQNNEVDKLLKEGMLLNTGKWIFKELVEGTYMFYEHYPFL
jgi:ribonuclease HI